MIVFFFFSSRRRHTRFDCDWSSDVCSSDLPCRADLPAARARRPHAGGPAVQLEVHHPLEGAEHRSEEHTSELQSQSNLVCRLLLEKKKNKDITPASSSHKVIHPGAPTTCTS